ncbi:MAG: diacylglycerol kinase family lipid kinase [Tissierellaceae bacterium]|nr:diacylglycerol kinase family lipid kinase [Tissierellaceae bacterium]
MKKYLFIINPVAGNGKPKAVKPLIEEIMKKNQLEYEIVFTNKPKEATTIASTYEYDVIVAVGGDGTINEVTAGLVDRADKSLGIIPAGTGNDLSRSLNIAFDPREALEQILNGIPHEIPVGDSNGHSFLNISSVGFDVEVLVNTENIRKIVKGKFSYVLGLIYTLFKFKKRKVTIDIDGTIYHRNILLLALGNGRFYGGGMMIIPDANPFDDYLYVCLVKDISNMKALTVFPVIFKGNHLKFTDYVETFKAKSIKITNDSPFKLNVDGEILEEGKEIIFKLSDKKISIIL